MNILFTSSKYIAAMLYSALISVLAVKADSYEAVFSDVFFYIAGGVIAILIII